MTRRGRAALLSIGFLVCGVFFRSSQISTLAFNHAIIRWRSDLNWVDLSHAPNDLKGQIKANMESACKAEGVTDCTEAWISEDTLALEVKYSKGKKRLKPVKIGLHNIFDWIDGEGWTLSHMSKGSPYDEVYIFRKY